MAHRPTNKSMANSGEDTCPECRINQVEPPFDYCSMCEMLSSYFRERVATPEQLRDRTLCAEAFDKWRRILTWAEIEKLRDEYWTATKQAATRTTH